VPEDVFSGTAFVRRLGAQEAEVGGLGEAAENLMFSAGEAQNTQKVIDKLEAQRRALKHKSGRGGKIPANMERTENLRAQLDMVQNTNSELLALEGTLRELELTRCTIETNKNRAAQKNREYDALVTLRKFDEAKTIEGKINTLREEKETLRAKGTYEDHFAGAAYIAALRDAAGELSAMSAAIADAVGSGRTTGAGRLPSSPTDAHVNDTDGNRHVNADAPVGDDGNRPAASDDEIIARAQEAEGKRRTYVRRGIFCMVFFFLVVPLIIGIRSFIAASRQKKAAAAIYAEYGAAGLSDLARALAVMKTNEEKATVGQALEQELAMKYAEYDRSTEAAKELLATHGVIPDTDIGTLLIKTANELSENLSAYERVSEDTRRCEAQLSGILSALQNEDEKELRLVCGDIAPELFDNIDVPKMRMEQSFYEKALSAHTEKIHAHEIRRAQLCALAADPVDIAVQIAALEDETLLDKQKYDAYVLAIETLLQASESVRGSIVPIVSENTCRLMDRLTSGKYTSVGVNSDFEMSVISGDATKELDYFSSGTKDVAYLALRMSLVSLLYKQTYPPLIFDESFAETDDARTASFLALLDESAKEGHQSLIFTCRSREIEIMDKIGMEYGFIPLRGIWLHPTAWDEE